MNIITIDTGTTNTRVYLWRDDLCLDHEKRSVGVRNTSIDGNNNKIISAIGSAYSELIDRNNLHDSDVDLILASGMITSNLGLVDLPHLVAPVGLDEFSKSITSKRFDLISRSNPIYFIPGVKNIDFFDSVNLHRNDFMRGEEVEVIGMIPQISVDNQTIIALPGSHSKYVEIDRKGRIVSCFTTMAGEILEVVTTNTILSSSLEKSFCSDLRKESLLKGFRMSMEFGVSRSLFAVRALDIQAGEAIEELTSFSLGVVIASDVQALLGKYEQRDSESFSIVVAGHGVFSDALYLCLKDTFKNASISRHVYEEDKPLSGTGAIAVAKKSGLISGLVQGK
ncbi:2-dehydro-3-deoxygalactonokinase [Marinobacterium sedimentorum]|uniref:2-dehydro-3-deoxygalactonokinase n=1 Tax=Marinobacterium sedimentorum TaxID=2927804 RepID=UPI0020C720CB|nr:2-dehydro-3-deoxygalactonokinase [Marinobacterium sedimentorum]MCP8689503.1 2-dehydro-3-deoxygalactonokinase [Marinobacterium sedimentorum]